MSTLEDPVADVELGQQKRRQRRRRRRQRQSISGAGGSESTTDGSRYFSDSEDDHPSWQSSPEKCGFPDEMERSGGGGGGSGSGGSRRKNGKEKTAAAAEEFDEVDLENGDLEMRVHVSKKRRVRRECRICQMRLVEKGEEDEVGIELGCFCKGDLGDCHKKCAEAWFKLKGDTTCEICGAIAMNVVIEPPVINEADININAVAAAGAAGNLAPAVAANLDPILELQNYWHGRRVMNAILTCLVLALVISWIFHFNLGSKN